jgi:hypothetical protein
MSMDEEKRSEGKLAAELRELGKQLSLALRTAWESEQRQQLQKEIGEGLQELSKQVDQAVAAAKTSPQTQRVKEQVSRVAETARQSETVHEIREDMVEGLHQLNEELRRLVERMQQKQKSPGGQPSSEPPPGDVDTTAD